MMNPNYLNKNIKTKIINSSGGPQEYHLKPNLNTGLTTSQRQKFFSKRKSDKPKNMSVDMGKMEKLINKQEFIKKEEFLTLVQNAELEFNKPKNSSLSRKLLGLKSVEEQQKNLMKKFEKLEHLAGRVEINVNDQSNDMLIHNKKYKI